MKAKKRTRPPSLAVLTRLAQQLLTPGDAAASAVAKLRLVADDHDQLVANVLLSTDGAIQAFVQLLDSDAVDDAVALLHNESIALSEAFKDELVRVGAVGKLVALLESEEDAITCNAAGAIGLLVIVNEECRADGHLRVQQVYEAGAVPALHSILARGAASNVAKQAAVALANIVDSGNTSIEWAMLKWLEDQSPPVDFPDLMDTLRETSAGLYRRCAAMGAALRRRASKAGE